MSWHELGVCLDEDRQEAISISRMAREPNQEGDVTTTELDQRRGAHTLQTLDALVLRATERSAAGHVLVAAEKVMFDGGIINK